MITSTTNQAWPIRIVAIVLSYVFHPLFIPIYITVFLIRIHPYLFAGMTEWDKLTDLLQVIVNCTFLPIVSVLLLRALKFIDSIQLKTQKDRIIPYITCMIFYFWNWYAFKNNFAPAEIVMFSLGMFVASILGFMANIYFKISMHAIAVGLVTAFMAGLTLTDSSNLSLYLAIAVIIAGLVCTARLILSDHRPMEIYLGLGAGFLSYLISAYFV